MNIRKIRTGLVTAVAVLGASAAVLPAVSQAAPVRTSPQRVASVSPTLSTSSTTARATSIVNGAINTPPVSGTTAVALEGHTTGDPGSAPEQNCQALGNMANNLISYGDELSRQGDKLGAMDAYGKASTYVNNGLDEGCFFID